MTLILKLTAFDLSNLCACTFNDKNLRNRSVLNYFFTDICIFIHDIYLPTFGCSSFTNKTKGVSSITVLNVVKLYEMENITNKKSCEH